MSQYARFIKAKNLDKRMVLDYLQGQDPRKVYPLYHALWYLPLPVLLTSSSSGNWRRSRWKPNSAVTATSPLLSSCMTGEGISVVRVLAKTEIRQ